MKRILSLLTAAFVVLITITSCNKNEEIFDSNAQYELEKPIIEAYVKKNYPDAKFDEKSGIWYEIIKATDNQTYEYTIKDSLNQKFIFSEGLINYTGKLVSNGSIFDKTKDPEVGTELPIALNLTTGQGSVIPAWFYGFYPKKFIINGEELTLGIIFEKGAQAGDKFRIITPSYLAYGNRANGAIPANSPLDFEIEVIKMKDYKIK